MRPMTEADVREALVNAGDDDLRLVAMPEDFLLTEWDHLDFLAWRDPRSRGRGYIVVEQDGNPLGVVLRAAEGRSRARSAMCNICHTMQPAGQVTLFTAKKAATSAAHPGSVGTYICADLSCHENVRLAAPLAPMEMRASVDRKIDGARHRSEAFVASIVD